MLFNCNNVVKVKLTEYGKQILREQNLLLNRELPSRAAVKSSMPREDGDGWSEWQLWVLMSRFGEYIATGGDEPFGMDIEIPTDGGR